MKKSYDAPEFEIIELRADERFATNCGIVDTPSNVPPHDKGCWLTWGGSEVAPYNS